VALETSPPQPQLGGTSISAATKTHDHKEVNMKNENLTILAISQAPETATSWRGRVARTLTATALLGIATLSIAQTRVADCAPGKLSDYEKLGATGCLIGDKRFFNFQYHQEAAGLPSSAISVTPGTIPETDDPGILFEGKWSSASRKSYVSYIVEVQPNGKPITAASLEMQFGEITGTGKATVLADLCPVEGASQSCGGHGLELKVVLSAAGSKKPLDKARFTEPQQQIRVVNPVDVDSGSGGSASLDGFMAVFH
jgi:hypothetical protein